jgi:hypothetical protein
MRSLRKNQSGVIWIWAICLLAIVLYSICWFSLGWPLYMVIDTVEASYTFPAQATNTINLMRLVIAWHPIFFIFGMLLWAFVNSQRREEVTYPVD